MPTLLTSHMLAELSAEAAAAPRRRKNRNFHPVLEDPVQRLCNAVQPGSYVRPHRHAADRWEMFIVLQGAFAVLTFDAAGQVLSRDELGAGGPTMGIEIPGGTFHSVVALAPDSVFFEIKQGPYVPVTDKDFAAWAPTEGAADSAVVEEWMRAAQPGDTIRIG